MAEGDKLDAFMKEFGVTSVTRVMTTHKHWDHADGNTYVKQMFPDAEIVGGAVDKVKECTKFVQDRESFVVLNDFTVTCHHTPCHTTGHILFELSSTLDSPVDFDSHKSTTIGNYQVISGLNRCVFTGDTIFLGGCGKFFEGQPSQMLDAMDRAL